MRKNLLCTGALLLALGASAQTVTPQVISSNGGSAQNSTGGIEWTIGEPVSSTYISSNHITTMGFHQPDLSVVNLIDENKKGNLFLVYPNPVRDELRVDFGGVEPGLYSLILTDAAGRLISKDEISVDEATRHFNLHLSERAAGNYFLSVMSSSFSTSVKINKVQ